MGYFNRELPIDEDRFHIIPAAPGWEVMTWEGSMDNLVIYRAPIIAWHVAVDYYTRAATRTNKGIVIPPMQQWIAEADPIWAGGQDIWDKESDMGALLAPDGRVYKRTGATYNNIKKWVAAEEAEFAAADADSVPVTKT